MRTAAVPLWTPTSPQRGWLTCASVLQPLEQWPLCAGRRRAISWSATAAGARAVPPSFRTDPASAATRTLHTLLHWPLPHTQCSLPLAPGTQGPRPTRRPDSAVRRRAAMSCSPSAQHRAALSSTSARRDGSPQQPRPARRPHRDAPPHASLAVTLHHSPESSIHSLETAPTQRSVISLRGPSVPTATSTPCCATP